MNEPPDTGQHPGDRSEPEPAGDDLKTWAISLTVYSGVWLALMLLVWGRPEPEWESEEAVTAWVIAQLSFFWSIGPLVLAIFAPIAGRSWLRRNSRRIAIAIALAVLFATGSCVTVIRTTGWQF